MAGEQPKILKSVPGTAIMKRGVLTDSFAGTASTASAACLYTVLLEICVIGVAGTRVQVGFGIVMRSLILVLNEQSNRGSEGNAMLSPGLDLNKVLLVSLANEAIQSSGATGFADNVRGS